MANGHERPRDLHTATGSAFISETSEFAAFHSAKRNEVPAEKGHPSSGVLQSEDALSKVARATPVRSLGSFEQNSESD
jgi:hypothetical protein